jgi:two-component system, NtrC family, sensor kinase
MIANLLEKLPTILVLAVLVGIFVALRRHVRSPRLTLWIAAWGLIFVHFVAGTFEPPAVDDPPLVFAFAWGSLQLSAVFFIASLTSFFENKKLTRRLVLLTGVPVTVYTVALGYGCTWRSLYIGCLVMGFIGPLALMLAQRQSTTRSWGWMPVLVTISVVAIFKAWHHQFDFGFLAFLTTSFSMPAFLFWRRYNRWSPGVLTSAGGFALWGAVFPLGMAVAYWAPNLKINPELWNTPKFFVAFGMILTLLEDKSQVLEASNDRERQVNEQMQRFAGITSRLLTGIDVSTLCHEIAEAIRDTSTFQRVGIVLSVDGKTLTLAGHAGMDAEEIATVENNCDTRWRLDHVKEIFSKGMRVGESSRLVRARYLIQYNLTVSAHPIPADARWEKGDRVFIPLQSSRGTYVGCISLDDPRDISRINGEELTKIELLASDLAVTLDNSSLHKQLLRSEKLAAIGQLVAGVAHELNNPLASVVGYSELLTDEIPSGPSRNKLDKIIRESQRMRRIIENLLRFARQNNLAKKSTNVAVLLQEVLSLREYHLRSQRINLDVQIEPTLPAVALDEDQFKQILLNLLNNSIDALEHLHQRTICISAKRRDDRVVVLFDDNGPGFSDPDRVFDPFYTTKPVGKGTGLGLSICYGIAKEHGGDIQALNLESGGARIVLELPGWFGDIVGEGEDVSIQTSQPGVDLKFGGSPPTLKT